MKFTQVFAGVLAFTTITMGTWTMVSLKAAPAQEAPAQEAPSEEVPSEEAPSEEAPAQEAPSEGSLRDAESLEVIQSVAPEVLENLAATDSGSTVTRSTDQVIAESSNDLTVEISLNPQKGIVMNDEAMPDENIGISIGRSQQAETGVEVQPGIVSFETAGETSVSTVLKRQGSVQITTVIRSSTDPTRYDYDLSLPSDAQIVQQDGVVIILNSRGELIGGLAQPWARDSEGREIPTHYEVNGSTITQIVAHNSGDWTYPIVADPGLQS